MFDLTKYQAALKQAQGGIVIRTDADLTPAGKRVARVVSHALSGKKTALQIRLYVGGKAFRTMSNTGDNRRLVQEWIAK